MAETKIQLNLTFVPAEDRLLFKIASGRPGVTMEEYQFWLTRRLVKLLWNALDHMIDVFTSMDPRIPPEGRNAVKQFQESAALSNADFATPYASEKVTAPLGTTPLLIHKFQARRGTDGNQILALEVTTGQTINISLSLDLLYSLRKLLSNILKEAEWDLNPNTVVYDGSVYIEDVPKTIN